MRLKFGIKVGVTRGLQAFMDKYLNQLSNRVVYIDDILIYSKTQEEHYKLLEQFIEIIKTSGIVLSKKKMELFKTQIEFLGFEIDKAGIKMQDHIAQKIIEFQQEINTKKELQKFLGIVNQVREFIPKLSQYTEPLTKKLKQDYDFKWNDTDTKTLEKIKELVRKRVNFSLKEVVSGIKLGKFISLITGVGL